MPVEIELKLAIAEGDVARLRRHPLLKGGKANRSKLYGIYFDTPDWYLYQSRGAFRLRREGYHWVQTVKLDRGSTAGLSMRPEYEVQVTGNQPDFEVLPREAREALTPDVEARLAPVFVTDFQRSTWLISQAAGVVEIALDLGHIRQGEMALPLAEVELELKSGDSQVLFETAQALLEAVPLVPEYRSKALRGYGLAGVWSQTPCKTIKAAIAPELPATETWRRSLLAALTQLGRNIPGLLADDHPEYVHQARVAVRRLRSLLSLGKPLGCVQEEWIEDLRWYMGELSPARDLDVLVSETLMAVSAGLPNADRLSGLLERAGRQRQAARERARVATGSPRLASLILAMQADLLAERAEGPSTLDWAAQSLNKRLRRLHKLARHFDRLDAPARHQVRIAGKRLRYAGEAFADLYGGKAGRYLANLSVMQDGLGVANDLAVAQSLLGGLNQDGGEAYAVGLVEGYLAALAASHADSLAEHVDKVLKAAPFWSA